MHCCQSLWYCTGSVSKMATVLIAGVCQPGGREPQRAELIREEPKARCWFRPLSGSCTCRCATSAWVMAGLWKPSAAKMLMCFRWRAGPACGWIFVLLLVLKMYVNPQVTGLSNTSSDGVPAFPWRLDRHVLMSLSWNRSDDSIKGTKKVSGSPVISVNVE